MQRSIPMLTGGAAVVALVAVPTFTAAIAESPAAPEEFAQCLVANGVPAELAGLPQGPPPGGQRPEGPPPGGQRPDGPPPQGQHPAPPAPAGVDATTWNNAFVACADLAGPPPGHRGPPPSP